MFEHVCRFWLLKQRRIWRDTRDSRARRRRTLGSTSATRIAVTVKPSDVIESLVVAVLAVIDGQLSASMNFPQGAIFQ